MQRLHFEKHRGTYSWILCFDQCRILSQTYQPWHTGSTNVLYQKAGFSFQSSKAKGLTKENLDAIIYAWAKPTLAWDGWFQLWPADGNITETEPHRLYGQPEFTVPANLFCTCLRQQRDCWLRRPFCLVLSVVCRVVRLQGWMGLSDEARCAGQINRLRYVGHSLWCISYCTALDLNGDKCFRRHTAEAAGQLSFRATLIPPFNYNWKLSPLNHVWLEVQWTQCDKLLLG